MLVTDRVRTKLHMRAILGRVASPISTINLCLPLIHVDGNDCNEVERERGKAYRK